MKNPLEQAAREPKGKDPFSPFLLRLLALTSWIWCPLTWMLAVVSSAMANSYLSDEQLSQLVMQLLMGGIVTLLALFTISFCGSVWFRRNSIWIILAWIIMSQTCWTTQGALNRSVIRSTRAVTAQLKVLEEQKAARQP